MPTKGATGSCSYTTSSTSSWCERDVFRVLVPVELLLLPPSLMIFFFCCFFCTLSLFKTRISTWGKSQGKGGRPARGRVPRRTCRRSNYCGFAEVLGLSRAELSGTNIGFRDFKMTARSFRTSLAKWDPLTRPGW